MTPPQTVAYRFLAAFLLGIPLGLYYGFLRPLRPRHTVLSDLLFVPALFWAWLQLSFGVCQGDLRLGYTAGLFLGAVLWELSFGRLLRPLFQGFWSLLHRCVQLFLSPFKNFFVFLRKKVNFLLATAKKKGYNTIG